VQRGEWITDSSVRELSEGLYGKSSGLPAAVGRAIGVVAGRLRLQAFTLTFIDGFHLVAWACVLALLLAALLRKAPLNYGELAFGGEEMEAGGKAS
jgi:hypothetical protein